jgi:hypothetical protein
MKKNLTLFVAIVGTSLSGAGRAVAQDRPQSAGQNVSGAGSPKSDVPEATSDADIQMLRKDLRSQKKQIVAANTDLTDAQAEKFWPVYDQYTADLVKINDAKAALVQQYAQSYDTMTGDQAESYLRKRTAVEESIMQLRVKYVPIFRKVLSGRATALFFQIDWRLGLMIDLQLAQLPLINP